MRYLRGRIHTNGSNSRNFLKSTLPLFSAPQTLHIKMAFTSPYDSLRRSPQSVQKTSDPMAAIDIEIGQRTEVVRLIKRKDYSPLSYLSLSLSKMRFAGDGVGGYGYFRA